MPLSGWEASAQLCSAGDALYLQPAEEGLPLYIAELLGLAEDAHGGKSAEVRCVLNCCGHTVRNGIMCLHDSSPDRGYVQAGRSGRFSHLLRPCIRRAEEALSKLHMCQLHTLVWLHGVYRWYYRPQELELSNGLTAEDREVFRSNERGIHPINSGAKPI